MRGDRRGRGGGRPESRDVLLIDGEFGAFLFIADEDGRAVGGLDAEDVVEVGLVGGEDEVELWVLFVEPGEVAPVVVVGEEGIGAEAEEVGEGGVGAEGGGIAEGLSHGLEELLVFLVVWDADEALALALDDGRGVVDGGFFGGVLLDVLLDLGAGEAAGVELVAGRDGVGADEGAVFVKEVEATCP